MSRKETIEEKTWNLLVPEAEALGLLPVDAEYVKERDGYSLLIYIDKEGGVTIDDCELLSKRLDPILDEEDFISDPYTMIVSSPGLGRVIRRPRDFIFAKGKEVDVRTYKPVNGTKEFSGILTDFDDKKIVLASESGETEYLRADIAQIRLTVHF